MRVHTRQNERFQLTSGLPSARVLRRSGYVRPLGQKRDERPTMSEALLFTYAIACGFVFAAVLATGYQAFANRPARFELVFQDASSPVERRVLSAFLVVWAAPYIIMRNAVRGRLLEKRHIGWLAASTFIAALWSLYAGILVISLAIVMG